MRHGGTPAWAVCLTSDLVSSRHLRDRSATQLDLERTFEAARKRCGDKMLVPLALTVGDEWQGLFVDFASALDADFFVRDQLGPLAFASGVGVGRVETPLRERTGRMDGQCFHRSRAALEEARKRKRASTVVSTDDSLLDDHLNTTLPLLHAVAAGWSPRQRETICAYRDLGTETATAERLGVSQPTVHKSLERSLGKIYLESRQGLLTFVKAFGAAA